MNKTAVNIITIMSLGLLVAFCVQTEMQEKTIPIMEGKIKKEKKNE